jgi:hypothetical protein
MRDTKKRGVALRGHRIRNVDAIPAGAGTAYCARGPSSMWSSATRLESPPSRGRCRRAIRHIVAHAVADPPGRFDSLMNLGQAN